MDEQPDSESLGHRIPDLTDDVAITDPLPIFSGPYSDLFRGECDGQHVAVKVIRSVSRKRETMRRKLVRERTAWGYLDHPNVLRLLGYTQPSRDFGYFGALISPWCEAGDAEALLTEHGTSLVYEHRRDLWLGTVAGVRYLHLNTPMVIHGDLKPNNILISDDGTPKICDFGLARIVFEERDSGLTTTTPHTGTHRYLAPELLQPGGLPSTASDVYALGSIGLRFLFDVHPYKNTAPYMVLSEIHSGIPPASRPPDLQLDASELWDLLDICWPPEPEERVNAAWLFANIPGPCRDPCTLREHIGMACSGICILDRRRDHATHSCLQLPINTAEQHPQHLHDTHEYNKSPVSDHDSQNGDADKTIQVDIKPHTMGVLDESPCATPPLDLLDQINGMYRLLDLISEQGSGGNVDKIIIAQESIKHFANHVHPGSYRSLTQVDFHALDQHTIKPLGVYGSISAIVDFLEGLGRIDPEIRRLLLAPRSEHTESSRPSLKPGLYLLDSTEVAPSLFYIIFWPEDTTWQDGSVSPVSRNRATFMRHLTKLSDQLVCLISDEHSANLVWKKDQHQLSDDDDDDDDRLFTFSVQQTNEEETAVAKGGFVLSHPSIEPPPAVSSTDPPDNVPRERLGTWLVVGETSQALLNVQYLPVEMKTVPVDEWIRPLALQNKLSAEVSPTIILAQDLDRTSLENLLDNGLWSRCGNLKSQWMAEKLRDEDKTKSERREEHTKKLNDINTRAWDRLRSSVQSALSKPRREGSIFTIQSALKDRDYNASFHVKGTVSSPSKAGLQYTLRRLEVKQDDVSKSSEDNSHVCCPVIRGHTPSPFVLPLNTKLRFVKLIGKDRCIMVLDDGTLLKIYVEHINHLALAIDSDRPVKRIHREKIGNHHLFAIDETKRLFSILSVQFPSVFLHIFMYDLDSKGFNAQGSSINISRWYHNVPSFTQLVFVAGVEELLLVEHNGSCRLFSLVTQIFRPSTLRLYGVVSSAASTPDGACLIVSSLLGGIPSIRCFHWASFGSSPGVDINWPSTVPSDAQIAVSSLGQRNITHVLFLDVESKVCQSLLVQITRKSSEFAFRSSGKSHSRGNSTKTTTNNSLLDCHAEVWTRFPIRAPIQREINAAAVQYPHTIIFVSAVAESSFALYFSRMIKDFEHNTRKPTRGLLSQIRVNGRAHWDPTAIEVPVSELQAGDWLVGLFCLIPIHLAVTESNRFIPLKDGLISPQFEQSLLGANVAQISEALSFGWYESILGSYLASKPVKVVTSMGEQSVGKSFTLNHFVDASFAGSAMRCTEGVWLSVTPTREYLVVAMDFEGVQSIEKSAQEDTLLVLLNLAISNLVLFRNNFALSRDIADLFTSFQSRTEVLDPASNSSLFHSTLSIIIKDVIDSDAKEIINEFQQKFTRFVQQERGDNFITKLHKGKLDIIPWPVIGSSRFYDLFGVLKNRFDRQPITHQHAGAFLSVLKMLMAKLKANDWGALDQNLAVQRSQQLGGVLLFALSLGTTDPNTGEPLKNYDTDELLVNTDTPSRFYVEGVPLPPTPTLSLLDCLKKLRMGWPDRGQRFSLSEQEFLKRYNGYLQKLADSRIKHVHTWLKANTLRFGEKTEVLALFRTFETLSKELRQSVQLCGSKCSSCGLLCLDHKQHDGAHSCMTSHKCPESCGFADQHEEDGVPACDLPAGHTGRHVCSGTSHLCGMACQLYGKDGCLQSCTKPMDHDEEGHLCAASIHTCGELCSLVKSDGTRLCTRPCVVDCRRNHDQHSCDRSLSCPVKCQLCNSFCGVDDHFHPLKEAAVHLCGQQHGCSHLCELPGICEIATNPQSIESTFIGRHAKFQYTKYIQEARRIRCVISIDPDKLDHDGPHVHSRDPAAFHFCEERCKHCGYYCTLPLSHRQSEHETSHGSMSHTEGVTEGDEDAKLELQGRDYATGDSGAPMLCSMICKTLGRHAHIDICRADDEGDCGGPGIQHMKSLNHANNFDRITHRLFWARSGFKDPYTTMEQAEFDLCDHRCGGDEHDADVNPGAVSPYCTLPLFHPEADPNNPPALGHVSQDGHVYNCKNPAL